VVDIKNFSWVVRCGVGGSGGVGGGADLEIEDGRRRGGNGFLPALGSGGWGFTMASRSQRLSEGTVDRYLNNTVCVCVCVIHLR
jgi:hypothetical protein